MSKYPLDNRAEETQEKWRGIPRWRIIAFFMALYDFVAVCGAYFMGLFFRFDGVFSAIPSYYLEPYEKLIFPCAAVSIVIFFLCRMYNSMWRYASFADFIRTFIGSMISSILHTILITVLFFQKLPIKRMPLSYYILGAGFQFIFLVAIRFAARFVNILRRRHEPKRGESKNVMLIGAGNAAQMILRDMTRANEINDRVVCIIDDNPNKWYRTMDGIPIVGGRDEIMNAAKQYEVDKIFLAIPSATMQQKRAILNICSETGCELQQLPGMFQFMLGQVSVSDLKKVSVEDLLGREPIKADMEEVFSFINGKTVMVTGGGGSIGSELCRQIAAHNPKQLIIFDIYENNLWGMQPLVT